jgi:hypothetical protein
MIIVSPKRTSRRPSPTGVEETSAVLENAANSSPITKVTWYVALKAGSSQQGKARRASVDANWVVAIAWVTPPLSTNVELSLPRESGHGLSGLLLF